MSEAAGLIVLMSNYELVDVQDGESELEVTTRAVVQPTEAIKLAELGWVQRSENKFAFIKTRGEASNTVRWITKLFPEPPENEELEE